MKRITLYALIGFALMSLLSIFYLGNSIYLYCSGLVENYNPLYIVTNFIRVIAIALITYFFFALYKKQSV